MINKRLPEEVKTARLNMDKPNIPKWKMDMFEDDMTSALDKDYLLEKVARGTVSKNNVDDFKTINPYLYSRMSFQLYDAYTKKQSPRKYSYLLGLSTFLGRDLTGLEGGTFNVNNEAAEPITALNKQVHQKADYVKGQLKNFPKEEQSSPSVRYATM